MTDIEIAQAIALGRCKFSPGTTAKRFVAWAAFNANNHPDFVMTAKATAFLDRLAHQYRKQIGRCMSVACAAAEMARAIELIDLAIDLLASGEASGGTALYDACRRMGLCDPHKHPLKDAVLSQEGPAPSDISVDERIASLQTARRRLLESEGAA